MKKLFTINELLAFTNVSESGCMEWTKGRTAAGYGQKWDGEKVSYAHRIVCELAYGETYKMEVLHSCDNPPCINPKHLSWGTRRDNSNDMIAKKRDRKNPQRGSKHGGSKLLENDIINICMERKNGLLLKELSEKYGTSISNIHLITSNKHWKSV